jgi:hypothetical protein
VLAILAVAVSCSGSGGDGDGYGGIQGTVATDLGRACLGSTGSDACGDSLECTDADSIGGPVCTLSCDRDADCPANGLCYIFDQNDGHICARVCQSDADCDALVPGMRCLERSSTGARRICAD